MKDICILSQNDLRVKNGNTVRPLWEADGLKKHKFENFDLVSTFGSRKKIEGYKLYHAHLASHYILPKGVDYVCDIHNTSWDNLRRYIIYTEKNPFKKLLKKYFLLPIRKNKEENQYKKAKMLICAGEIIEERVNKLNSTVVVRNAVDIKQFKPTNCESLRVGVIGPFLKGSPNYYCLSLLKAIVKNIDSRIQFVLIGSVDNDFKKELNFKNVQFTGYVEDYIGTLRKISVALMPYTQSSSCGGSKNKILEAAACNIPIITTKVGATDFYSKDIFVEENPRKIAEIIEELKDDNLRKNVGKNLRKYIEINHNHLKESKKLIKIYEELL